MREGGYLKNAIQMTRAAARRSPRSRDPDMLAIKAMVVFLPRGPPEANDAAPIMDTGAAAPPPAPPPAPIADMDLAPAALETPAKRSRLDCAHEGGVPAMVTDIDGMLADGERTPIPTPGKQAELQLQGGTSTLGNLGWSLEAQPVPDEKREVPSKSGV